MINVNEEYFINVYLTQQGEPNTETSHGDEASAREDAAEGWPGLEYVHTIQVQHTALGNPVADVIDLSPEADVHYFREVAADLRQEQHAAE